MSYLLHMNWQIVDNKKTKFSECFWKTDVNFFVPYLRTKNSFFWSSRSEVETASNLIENYLAYSGI